jgi:hypothetical protein
MSNSPIDKNRRKFFRHLAALTGAVVIAPMAVGCAETTKPAVRPVARVDASGAPDIPLVKPANWDPIAFNKERGLKGAIPKSYYADINGPDGDKKHLGKHLPYIPDIKSVDYPEGYIPIMWGDPSKGFAQHPNSTQHSPGYTVGHWYNWVRVQNASIENAQEIESQFHAWPGPRDSADSTVFGVMGSGSIEDNDGKNTIYMLSKPADLNTGDTMRIYGHCLYHGEYVDFVDYILE